MKLQLDMTNYDACPSYNQWLDDQHVEQSGQLDIFGFQPRPSFILFSLSQDTYQAAFADFLSERQEALKRLVFEEFPAPIAHYFYRFEKGYESDLQRLHFLRDTWEAIVDVLHAIAVGECRFRGITLADPITFRNLLSDSVAQRIQNIELIVAHAQSLGVTLSISKIVATGTLQSMRELNQSRNGFSHSSAQSEAQARQWINECYEDVMDVLDDLRGLAEVRLLKYGGQVDGTTLRCELFRGHGFTKTIVSLPLVADQVRDSSRYFQQGQLLVCCDGVVLSARPLMHYREDATGHMTKLCMFRKTRGDAPNRRLEFAVVGEGVPQEEDRLSFKSELDEIRGLLGLGPD
jgi:hypothetical protein